MTKKLLNRQIIFDIGPNAGSFGGNLVAHGNLRFIKNNTLTAKYLKELNISIPFKKEILKLY